MRRLRALCRMADKTAHLALGLAGEDRAARHLADKGWRILARNWRPSGAERGLELDIVALHGDSLVFVEVKTRRVAGAGPENGRGAGAGRAPLLRVPAYAALTPAKRGKLARAAGHYLTAHALWHKPCRFDLVCVEQFPDGRLTLEHHSNVIELRPVVGGGNAAWQPW